MVESRWQRWSRKKAEANRKVGPTPAPAQEPEPSAPAPEPEQQELAINETLSEQELLDKYGLPDPASIEIGTDITGFMRREIPEFLRRKALRSLWKSNPVLAVLDGLNDYDEDYTLASTAGQTVSSLYRVGEGMVEKAKKAAEVVDEPTSSLAQPSEVEPVSDQSPEAETAIEADQAPEPQVSGNLQVTQAEPEETEEAPEPRFRPRMRFDY
ncbi:Protein of unknown function [Marinobacter gudaonensis]|uniref:DUF3306 domain-containing protein n=1 Tax=Marinobacter gudaonensis TaxID=375760 RepID=A0A1I6H7F1_9GAMM|nr:DUF3306 domain-containing protein [Marinobacter gudaonensis]SFR50234.1 Protein of unknown function [Marinobacter gudaonensis]